MKNINTNSREEEVEFISSFLSSRTTVQTVHNIISSESSSHTFWSSLLSFWYQGRSQDTPPLLKYVKYVRYVKYIALRHYGSPTQTRHPLTQTKF